jgi:hypothetical protein
MDTNLRLAPLLIATGCFLLSACQGESGPEGSVQSDCLDYASEKAQNWADSQDGLIPGILTVGFVKDTKIAAAKRYLETLETSFYIPTPYREAAVVCTDEGWEDHWEAILDAEDAVIEWAHREGITPLAGE